MRTSFKHFITMKICIEYSFIRFHFSFYILFIAYRLTIKSFLIMLLTLSQISLYFSSESLSFKKKDIYLVSSGSLIYALIFGSHNFFKSVFVPNKINQKKPCQVLLFYQCLMFNHTSKLVKIVFFNFSTAKRYNFFIHFVYGNELLIF